MIEQRHSKTTAAGPGAVLPRTSSQTRSRTSSQRSDLPKPQWRQRLKEALTLRITHQYLYRRNEDKTLLTERSQKTVVLCVRITRLHRAFLRAGIWDTPKNMLSKILVRVGCSRKRSAYRAAHLSAPTDDLRRLASVRMVAGL